MKVHFSIQYNTAWGESLAMKTAGKLRTMEYAGGGRWEVSLGSRDIRPGDEYTYIVVRGGKTLRSEWRTHTLCLPDGAVDTDVRDRWIDRPADSAFWASAFKDVIFRRDAVKPKALKGNVLLRTAVAQIKPGQALGVTGSIKALGAWKKPVTMDGSRFPWWETAIDAKEAFEYKYVITDAKSGGIIAWEEGANHFCPAPGMYTTETAAGMKAAKKNQATPKAVVVADTAPRFNITPWRGAGVAIPVFSLRTENSFGVGEFADIKKMADWAGATGQNIIQLLPINDTTMTGSWQDSYPYNAVSSFALHPQFLNLPAAGIGQTKAYKALQTELNALPQVDYERVNTEKIRLLHKHFSAKADALTAEAGYTRFVQENAPWLTPYAVFCCLRDENRNVDWRTWGKWSKYSKKKADAYAKEHPQQVAFWYWVHYQLDMQLKDAVAYAHSRRVAIKGDLPIGVSPVSVDAWTNPELFNLDMQAGAPPDAFSADGQNWGFPTYNWDKMSEDGYAWWKARLKKMSEYFDAYRIDHILGFFRIWEIPAKYKSGLMGHFSPALPYSGSELAAKGFDVSGGTYVTPGLNPTDVLFVQDPRRKGFWHPRISAQYTPTYARLDQWHKDSFNALYNDFFYHRHEQFWRESAMKKLPSLLRCCDMLSCGEDLGMIPGCVASVMEELNILSLEIQRMPKDPKQDFADPARYPYWCVCATGTHDTSTLRAWWEEDRSLTAKYYAQMMHRSGQPPYYCEPWVAEAIVGEHLASPAMLTILPLQDWLATDGAVRYAGDPQDERINIPANPRHYWRWRMHKCLEELIADKALGERLRLLIQNAGRGL